MEVPAYKYVKCFGLLGTYDDGLDFLKRPEIAARPKAVLSMGSSVGNFPREEAVGFIEQFAAVLGPQDKLIVGVDACQEPDRVYHAYNDRHGITHDFVANGLRHANELLGYNAFKKEDWKVIGEYDEANGRHQAFVIPNKALTIEGVSIVEGERVRIEGAL